MLIWAEPEGTKKSRKRLRHFRLLPARPPSSGFRRQFDRSVGMHVGASQQGNPSLDSPPQSEPPPITCYPGIFQEVHRCPVDRLGQHGVVVGVLDVLLETFDLTFGPTDVAHSFSDRVDDRVAVDTIQMYGGGSANALLV